MNNTPTRTILLILLVSAALRIGSITGSGHTLTSDELDYLQLAEQLRNGGSYATPAGPTAYRPPAYPFLIAGLLSIISSLPFVFSVQILLELLTCYGLYRIGSVIGGAGTGITAMGVWALLPSSVIMPGLLMSETFFTAVMTAMVLQSVTGERRPVLTGVLLGISILLKPQMLLLGGMYAVWLAHTGAWKKSLMIAGTAAILIAPWIIRNAAVMDAAVLTTNGGVNFWIGNNPEANGSYRIPSAPLLEAGATEQALNNEGYRRGLSFLMDDPAAGVLLAGKKLAHLWSSQMYLLLAADDGIGMQRPYRDQLREVPMRSALSVDIPFVLLVVFGLAGLFLLPEGNGGARTIAVGILLLWCAVHMLYFGSARFAYPVLPLLAVTAAAGVRERHRIGTLPLHHRLLLAALAGGFLLLTLFQYVLIYL
ncbi:MAG: glycosyltransferase family 39 protein [Bacteroidetes bacterium]|nr:glycosyltransferase family 39 protein [Bacteroidota bacterium]